MSAFHAGDRVRCVDATPLPIDCPGSALTDFSFPDGFLEEGAVYLVAKVLPAAACGPRILLHGLRVCLRGSEIPWCGVRFRKLPPPGAGTRATRRKREPMEVGS